MQKPTVSYIKSGSSGRVFEGVVLAAGLSTRTPSFKLELPFDGIPIINRMIECMGKSCERVIVVGGYKIDRIRELTSIFPFVEVVFNPLFQTGMFSSVKEGIRHVRSQWFFFSPGDYPFINPSTYSALQHAMNVNPGHSAQPAQSAQSARFIFVPVINGRKGHPILMNRDIVPEILAEPGESNLKCFINRKGFCPVPVDDKGILIDIDTMNDYEAVSPD